MQVKANEIELTRFVASYVVLPGVPAAVPFGAPALETTAFFGVPGGATLVLISAGEPIRASISLNGVEVVSAEKDILQLALPVTLGSNNHLSISIASAATAHVSVRVKQMANVELHVQSRVHFNTNVSSFEAARKFYGKLGFDTVTGFPDTNTQEMARAIGIQTPTSYDGSKGESAGGYLLHGELISLDGFMSGLIDLIEFTIPRNDAPPYDAVNHLGMARAGIHTTNISADYDYMVELGVNFLSPPTFRADGSQFAIFTDLDGTFYELIEVEGDDEETETTHMVGLGYVSINVSDFERSRAWYQMMGYEVTKKLPVSESLSVAKAMGLDQVYELDGALLTHQVDDSTLEIVQWIKPYDAERPYSIPVNHLGIHRMAFSTSDIQADVATLKSQGVEFLSDITPCCSGPDSSGTIVAFYDPDGTIIELTESPLMGYIFPVLIWFRDIFR